MNLINEIFDARIALNKYVEIKFEKDLPYAGCVYIKNKKVNVILREGMTEEQTNIVLLHELAHVVRGDVKMNDKDYDEKLNFKIVNIASDVVINHFLDRKIIDELKLITYDGLKKEFPNLPPVWYGWRPIYDHIMEEVKKDKEKLEGAIKEFLEDIFSDGSLSGDELDEASVEAYMKVKVIVESNPHLKEIFDNMQGSPGGDAKGKGCVFVRLEDIGKTPNPVVVKVAQALQNILRRVKRPKSSFTKFKRTFRREGRVDLTRGSMRLPTVSASVAIDTSGSMAGIIHDVVAMLRALRHKFRELDFYCWSDTIAPKNQLVAAGAGTNLASISRTVKDYDAIIVLSDGEVFREDIINLENEARKNDTTVLYVVESRSEFDAARVSRDRIFQFKVKQ